MDLSIVPSFISAKIAMLSDIRAADAVRADQLTGEITNLRDRWSGKIQRTSDVHTDFGSLIEAAMAEQQAIVSRLSITARIIDECRAWIASLSHSAVLEQVTPEVETGTTLPAIRSSITRLQEQVAALKRVPLPSVDIRARVEDYIQSLTTPIIRGVAAGEQLTVEWPGPRTQFGAAPPADLFTLAAFLQPEAFAARLLVAINKAAPPSDRDAQIKDLESEIEKLERVEEVLVTSTGAARVAGRPPQVVLGCRIVTATRGAKAA